MAGTRKMVATGPRLLGAALAMLALAGCVGVQYKDRVTAHDLSGRADPRVTTQVLAAASEWRNSGVIARRGRTYRIQTQGRWRAAGTCDWTGADGDGMYGLLCPAWPIGRVIVARAHQTLIGKIGQTGAPFAIGSYHEFTASADGTLYLSMNEQFAGAHDNAGSVKATVSLKVPPRPIARAPAAAPPPAPRPAPVSAKSRFPARPVAVRFAKVPPRPDDVAVIIGNADYSKQGKDIPDVIPAYADAEGFKRYVIEALGVREGNIIDLRDATGSQMISVFGSADNPRGQLYDWVRPGRSRVHVYYSGHGAPGGTDGGAYLVPADADGARIELNGYPLTTLYRNLGALPAVSVTVTLEACFSGVSQAGSVISNASPVFLKAEVPPVPPRVTVIAAGAANQIASWEKDKSHGLFTKYFLKACRAKPTPAPTAMATAGSPPRSWTPTSRTR